MVEIPLFPLKLVLFNSSVFELEIFEPRYLRMVRRALANDTGIGIVYLEDGSEVHRTNNEPLELASVGTLSSIKHSEALSDSRLLIVVEGGAKFRIHSTWLEDDNLNIGMVDILRDDLSLPLRTKDNPLLELFENLNKFRTSEGLSQLKVKDNKASALSFRLSELLPMPMKFRQKLLEIDHPYRRLDQIERWVQSERDRV